VSEPSDPEHRSLKLLAYDAEGNEATCKEKEPIGRSSYPTRWIRCSGLYRLSRRGPEAAGNTNGRRRHVLLPPQPRTGKGLPKTIPTDVMVLDTDERLVVYCEVATDCTSTSSRTNAALQPSSKTPPASTDRGTITIVKASLDLADDLNPWTGEHVK
jgi:hypothetical protein